jgi:hypothetical protein
MTSVTLAGHNPNPNLPQHLQKQCTQHHTMDVLVAISTTFLCNTTIFMSLSSFFDVNINVVACRHHRAVVVIIINFIIDNIVLALQ